MSHSSRYQTVVQRRHVRSREIRIVVATFVVALVLGLGFYLGQRAAYSGMGIDPASYREMEILIPQQQAALVSLEQKVEVSQTRNEVDRAALEMVRQEIAGQEEQIRALEENLRFYQSLMSPEDIARGLTLPPVEIVATATPGRYEFRIVARQEARKRALMRGVLSVTVSGEGEGGPQSFPLSALSEDVEGESIALRFRYFQAIEGELNLPAGFRPSAVAYVAKVSSPKKVEIREAFPWSVQERFSYVGK